MGNSSFQTGEEAAQCESETTDLLIISSTQLFKQVIDTTHILFNKVKLLQENET